MSSDFEEGKQGSALAVLKVFDRVYQRITGDVSLFDKLQPSYLIVDKRKIAA